MPSTIPSETRGGDSLRDSWADASEDAGPCPSVPAASAGDCPRGSERCLPDEPDQSRGAAAQDPKGGVPEEASDQPQVDEDRVKDNPTEATRVDEHAAPILNPSADDVPYRCAGREPRALLTRHGTPHENAEPNIDGHPASSVGTNSDADFALEVSNSHVHCCRPSERGP